MGNTQKRLDKARPPRVQITYDVEIGGAESKKELPLVIGVVGTFAEDEQAFRDRRFIHIDKDNFSEVMKGLRPKVELLVDNKLSEENSKLAIELSFDSMDAFSPDSIVMQVEPLKKLLQLREQLSDLRNRTASNDRLKDELVELLNNSSIITPNEPDEAE
ncbi:type VI secretion system contractile sheath small subunit [Citrobacter arsenatis]|uniref:type VI secretion system contractile sheath small subunit n=1 Tax=Citrobacter arsenatis TaxID=2546350 RepID=UPI00300E0F59|nr:type VI secretion system contractile sheath small subunit [Salmonella enterica]EGW2853030.1 type VI secretion system contractile sheath small subunit [Salmonella enterica]